MDGEGRGRVATRLGNELKKTGARSARARTRGQNPLVTNIYADPLHFHRVDAKSPVFREGSLVPSFLYTVVES